MSISMDLAMGMAASIFSISVFVFIPRASSSDLYLEGFQTMVQPCFQEL